VSELNVIRNIHNSICLFSNYECLELQQPLDRLFFKLQMCEVPEMTMASASNIHSQTANKVKNA